MRCSKCGCRKDRSYRRNPQIIAYHCGGKPPSESFNPAFLGTGEGYRRPPNGPGFYFLTDKLGNWGADAYCKYVKKKGNPAWLYTASISTDMMLGCTTSEEEGLVDPSQKPAINQAILEIAKQYIPHYRCLGLGCILKLAEELGAEKANRLLVDVGVNGFVETFNNGLIEIAVYNPDAIEILEYECK